MAESYIPLRPDTSADRRVSHYDDEQAAMRSMLALEAGRMGSWRWDIVGGTVTGDPFVATLLNMDGKAQPWPVDDVFSSMHPDDLPFVQAAVDKALSGGDIYEVVFRDRIVDPQTGEEGLRWLGARGRVTQRDDDGAPLEMIGVNWDATREKTHEQSLAMLAGEMDHRVKNAFAVIRALISLGERSQGTKASFASTLKTQVQAMSDAHAISARMARQTEAPSSPVPVTEVIESALSPWLNASARRNEKGDGSDDRLTVTVNADETVMVQPRDVSAIAMLVYELATNATKYGPLGEAGGALEVTVTREDAEEASIFWRETVAGDAVGEEAKAEARDGIAAGFGSILIQHCISTLGARFKRDLTPTGLHVELHLDVLPTDGASQ